MRTGAGILAVLAVLVMSLQLGAQQQTQSKPWSSYFTGADPREIKFTPIDVTKASKAFNLGNTFHTPSPSKTLSLGGFFPKFTMPSWPPRQGVNQTMINQLPQSKNPFQPNRPVGVNLFEPRK